jgi:hypothetical protein
MGQRKWEQKRQLFQYIFSIIVLWKLGLIKCKISKRRTKKVKWLLTISWISLLVYRGNSKKQHFLSVDA